MHERNEIAAACLNFIKTSDALSHEAILEKLIQTDLAVARVTWAVNEWGPTKCNNKPLSLLRQLISIQMNLALCETRDPLCLHFVRQEYLSRSHRLPMKYAPRLARLLCSPPPVLVERKLLSGTVTNFNSWRVCMLAWECLLSVTLMSFLTSLTMPRVLPLSPSC